METIKKQMGVSRAFKVTLFLRTVVYFDRGDLKKARLDATAWTAFKGFKPGKYFKHQWSKTTRN